VRSARPPSSPRPPPPGPRRACPCLQRRLTQLPPAPRPAVPRILPLVRAGNGSPQLGSNAFVAPTATVVGDVQLGKDVNVWYGSIIRGAAGGGHCCWDGRLGGEHARAADAGGAAAAAPPLHQQRPCPPGVPRPPLRTHRADRLDRRRAAGGRVARLA